MAMDQQVASARHNQFNSGGPGRGYRLLYFFGFTPWDSGEVAPPLVELIEGTSALTPGRALDLGCGAGTQAIYLAKHGWQVTGIDYVHQALEKARHKAAAANVSPIWIEGDVTQLAEFVPIHNQGGYNLLLDFGCFHGLTPSQCSAYASGIKAIAAPGATFLLFSFSPGRRGPAPRGVSSEEIMYHFGADWNLLWSRPANGQRLPFFLQKANPMLYRLQRR